LLLQSGKCLCLQWKQKQLDDLAHTLGIREKEMDSAAASIKGCEKALAKDSEALEADRHKTAVRGEQLQVSWF
jgi:hypothetical protein